MREGSIQSVGHGGQAVIAATRITVVLVLEKLAAGETIEEMLDAPSASGPGSHPRCRGVRSPFTRAGVVLEDDHQKRAKSTCTPRRLEKVDTSCAHSPSSAEPLDFSTSGRQILGFRS